MFFRHGASSNIGGDDMLYGVTAGGARIGGVGEVSPYANWFGDAITDARNVLGLWNQAFPQSQVVPQTRYVPVPTASSGILGMDNTTMLIVGSIGIGAVYMFMKK